jgi:hypothetical protein
MPRTKGFRNLPREEQLHQFYHWLPPELHDAPGICWEDLPSEVLAYAVRAAGETPDAAPLAVAVAAANGQVQAGTQVKVLSALAPLLCALRESAGMQQVNDLHQEQLWRTFATTTEWTGRRSKQLDIYSSMAGRYIPAYLQRLSPDERQRMQQYALPALPPGFLKQHRGDARMNTVVKVAQHYTEQQINEKVAAAKHKGLKKRWEIVRAALVNPRPVAAIAGEMGVSPQQAMNVLTSYNRGGARAIETRRQGGGRNHSYLTVEEEQAFVSPFLKRVEAGEGVTFQEAKQAFEERVGREVNVATVFDLFARYGVRKFTRSYRRRQKR